MWCVFISQIWHNSSETAQLTFQYIFAKKSAKIYAIRIHRWTQFLRGGQFSERFKFSFEILPCFTLFKFESEASALISCSGFLLVRFVVAGNSLVVSAKFKLLESDVLLQVHQKPARKFSPYIRFTFNKHLWLSCSLLSCRAGLSAQFLFLKECVQSSAQNWWNWRHRRITSW